jgi:hypothetical protein
MKQKTFHIPVSNINKAPYLIPGKATPLSKYINMQGFSFDGYITINREDIPATIDKGIEILGNHLSHELIDDDYYYYTPDLVCQILFLASTDLHLWDKIRPMLATMLASYNEEYHVNRDHLIAFSLYFLDTHVDTRTLLNSFNYEINHHE